MQGYHLAMPTEDNRTGMTWLQRQVNLRAKELGMLPGFLDHLHEESDWAFVIQCHALLETLLTEELIRTVGRHELRDHFRRLRMSDKIKLLETLGRLAPDDRRFLALLSNVRNAFVHDLTKIRATLTGYIESLANGDRANAASTIGALLRRLFQPILGSDVEKKSDFEAFVHRAVSSHPRLLFSAGVTVVFDVLSRRDSGSPSGLPGHDELGS